MKKSILFGTITYLFIFNSFAQENITFKPGDTIYFNKGNLNLKSNYDSYSVFIDSIYIEGKKLYKMIEYKENKDQKDFIKHSVYHTLYPNIKGGDYLKTFFHTNGKKSSEGKLEHGLKSGKWTFWYEDGKIMSEEFYYPSTVSEKRKESEMISFWDRTGKKTVTNGNGTYEFKNDSVIKKGFFKNRKKHGKFVKFTNERKNYEEYYKKGKLKKGTSWDEKGKEYTYKETFITPYYPNGNNGIRKHVIKYFKVPEYAFKNKISGRILVSFKINKNGEISDINVTKKLCEPCDKEAIRVVKLLKKWKPGVMRGQKVKVGYTLPIKYNIE